MTTLHEAAEAPRSRVRSRKAPRSPVCVHFKPELEQRVEDLARRLGLSRSDVVRMGAQQLCDAVEAGGAVALAHPAEPRPRETLRDLLPPHLEEMVRRAADVASKLAPGAPPEEQLTALQSAFNRTLGEFGQKEQLSQHQRASVEQLMASIVELLGAAVAMAGDETK